MHGARLEVKLLAAGLLPLAIFVLELCWQLQELREEEVDGELAFTMVWQSLDTPYKMWADERRVKKYETYFGPGVSAEVVKIDAEQRLVGIKLTTTGNKPLEVAETAAEATA